MTDQRPAAAALRTRTDLVRRAEIRVPTSDFDADMRFFIDSVGFRLDRIWPADAPAFAALSGHGTAMLLAQSADAAPMALRLYVDDPTTFADGETKLTSPGGHRITVEDANPPLVIPEASQELVVRRLADSESWVIGRAGMHYRDLIPDRLGGAIIASHIKIADAGPVDDMVHYHAVGFQLIFCHRGRVRLVYEDQGPPFVLGAGDCVIQPPEIRHRVLESSGGFEVIEIGVPAEHLTTIDHEMELPTPHFRPDREFHGTKFLLHREKEATWGPWRIPGFEARETGIGAATKGVAGVQVVRRVPGIAVPASRHDADILFGFVREGAMALDVDGHSRRDLAAGDAFALPPHVAVGIHAPSDDLEIVEVALPAQFATEAVTSRLDRDPASPQATRH
jgi:quercetin dioxygenase-like cupin family protein